MHKILKIALVVLGLIAAIMSFFMMPDGEDPNAIDSTGINVMFLIMWVLLIFATVVAIFFGLKKVITTPGGLKKTLFGLAGLAILFIIGYALSSGEEAEAVVNTFAGRDIQPTASTVKTIGMLLNVFFAMVIVAVLLMVLPGVKRIFGR